MHIQSKWLQHLQRQSQPVHYPTILQAYAGTNLLLPLFDGDNSTYEDWKHKFLAYMALQHADYTNTVKIQWSFTTTYS